MLVGSKEKQACQIPVLEKVHVHAEYSAFADAPLWATSVLDYMN
jgi:hypothetical protein